LKNLRFFHIHNSVFLSTKKSLYFSNPYLFIFSKKFFFIKFRIFLISTILFTILKKLRFFQKQNKFIYFQIIIHFLKIYLLLFCLSFLSIFYLFWAFFTENKIFEVFFGVDWITSLEGKMKHILNETRFLLFF